MLRAWQPLLKKVLPRYVVAIVASVVALLWRQVMVQHFGFELPTYITFYPLVMAVAVFAGFWAGLLATVSSALLVCYWVLLPTGDFHVANRSDLVGLALFSGMGMFMSLVAERYRRSRKKAAAFEQELAVRESREALRRTEERWAITLRSIGDAVLTTDAQGRITFLNPVAETLTGWNRLDAAGEPSASVLRLVNEQTGEPATNIVEEALREGRAVGLANHTALITKTGRHLPIEDSAAPITDANGNVVGVVVVFHDVTERRRAQQVERRSQQQLGKLNRTLTALNNCSEALLRATAESELLQDICRVVTHDCGHAMVWIGYVEDGGSKDLRPVAHAGIEHGYLEQLQLTWDESERGRGPTGTAIRTAQPQVCRDILTDPRMQPWRAEALRRGYASSLALPLVSAGKVLGAMTLYAREADAFLAEEIDLLAELARNLAYGLTSLRARAAHEQAAQALRESEQQVRAKLESILSPEGDISSLELADIVDAPALQTLMEQFHKFANIPMAIIDLQGKVVVGVGWQDICTKFHRVNAECCKHCIESDVELSAGVPPGEFKLYQCKNHMWDVATPIVVGGKHMGNVFTGQFFFEGETPDREVFRAQARHYGFDETAYLAALERAPRLSREQLKAAMGYFMKLADMISRLSYSNIKLARALSEREELTSSLRSNETRLQHERDLLQAVMDGARNSHLVFLDPDFTFVRVNQAYAHSCGYGAQEMIGKNHFALYPHAENEAIFKRVRDTGEPAEFRDKPFEFPDQPERGVTYWDWTLHPVKDENAQVAGLVLALTETTQRKRTQEALRQSEEQLRVAAMAAEIGIWSWLPGTPYVMVSANWRRLFGIAPEVEVTFDTWREALHPDDRERAVRELNAASEQHHEFNCEYRVLRPDKSIVWIVDRGRASYDESGRAIGMAGINLDITELKQAQDALIRSEKLASVGRMAATIAHEINNPLAAVMNTLFLARNNAGSAEVVAQYLDIADEELKRIAHLTRQSLGFYRESSAAAPVRVDEVLHSAVDLLKNKSRAKNVRVVQDCAAELHVSAVRGELRQVFTNLLANSLDAVGQDGTVKVRVSRYSVAGTAAIRVTVADNGVGIDSAALPRLFEPFFTTKDAAGTGLGLWVTKQIINKHSGSIRVRSRTSGPHRGATFSLVLPAAAERSSADSTQSRHAVAAAS